MYKPSLQCDGRDPTDSSAEVIAGTADRILVNILVQVQNVTMNQRYLF